MAPKTLRQYLEQYASEHTQLGTKITHMIGIPMILASLPVLPFNPIAAGALFVGGWIWQYIGHFIFEKNSPAFYGDARYLFIGVVWVLLEYAQLMGIQIDIFDEQVDSTRRAA
jgi:uncharacterized membrane protein YGL010W